MKYWLNELQSKKSRKINPLLEIFENPWHRVLVVADSFFMLFLQAWLSQQVNVLLDTIALLGLSPPTPMVNTMGTSVQLVITVPRVPGTLWSVPLVHTYIWQVRKKRVTVWIVLEESIVTVKDKQITQVSESFNFGFLYFIKNWQKCLSKSNSSKKESTKWNFGGNVSCGIIAFTSWLNFYTNATQYLYFLPHKDFQKFYVKNPPSPNISNM